MLIHGLKMKLPLLFGCLLLSWLDVTNSQAVDIAFIVDGSGSVGEANFKGVFLPLVREVADLLPLSDDNYRLGFVLFGNEGIVEFDFNEAETEPIEDLLEDIVFRAENTNTTGGIKVAREQLFLNADAGARSSAAKIAFVLTDGPVTYDVSTLASQSQASRDAGIATYVIAVDNTPQQSALNIDHLETIANMAVEVFPIPIYDGFAAMAQDLLNLAEQLTDMIRGMAPTDAPTTTDATTMPTSTTTTPTTTTTMPTTTTASTTTTLTTTTMEEQTDPPTPSTTNMPTDAPSTTNMPTDAPTTTNVPTDAPSTTTTVAPSEQVSEWNCDFELRQGLIDTCDVMMGGDFKWMARIGGTPTGDTGPEEADDGAIYMYIESSAPRKENDTAAIYLPKRVFDGPQCLSFSAHMMGDNIGKLEVARMTSSGEEMLYSQSGEAADDWFTESVEADILSDDIGFVIRGIVGDGIRGDIALDTLSVRSGQC